MQFDKIRIPSNENQLHFPKGAPLHTTFSHYAPRKHTVSCFLKLNSATLPDDFHNSIL